MLTGFILSYLLTACTIGLEIIDDVPPGEKKGYVDFFQGDLCPMKISKTSNGREINRGTISCPSIWSWSRYPKRKGEHWGLRLSEPPGEIIFTLKVGTASRTVSVKILEGMITPISVDFVHLRTYSDYGYLVNDYEMQPPIIGVPITSRTDSSAIESLLVSMDESCRETRLLAVEALGMLQCVIPEKVIIRLKEIREFDTEKKVRDMANDVLEIIDNKYYP
ncbi:MAG: hypothetical protein V1779_10050 [bacterium]